MSSTKAASGQVVHRELAGWREKSETHTEAIECVRGQGGTPVVDHQDGGLAGRHDCSDKWQPSTVDLSSRFGRQAYSTTIFLIVS